MSALWREATRNAVYATRAAVTLTAKPGIGAMPLSPILRSTATTPKHAADGADEAGEREVRHARQRRTSDAAREEHGDPDARGADGEVDPGPRVRSVAPQAARDEHGRGGGHERARQREDGDGGRDDEAGHEGSGADHIPWGARSGPPKFNRAAAA